MANAVWNTGDRTNVTLTNANLTATGTGAGGVRSTLSTATGKYYWEVTTGTFSSGNSGIGAANASATLSNMGAAPVNAAVVYPSGNAYVNNVLAGTGLGSLSTPGTVVCVALDLGALLIWFRKGAAGGWSAGGNPATGTSGYSVSSIFTSQAALAAVALGVSGDGVTANFGDSAFAGVVPAGFTSGFLGGGGGTTWDPAHKNAAIALSGGNLVATSSAVSDSAVYATTPISPTIKQYFEVTCTGTVGQYLSIGVMNGSASLSANIAATNGASFLNNGRGSNQSCIYLNSTQFDDIFRVLASGQVVRVAIDRGANRCWWAINNNTWSGSNVWMDGSGSACDPNTGTGGLDISAVSGTIYPAISSVHTGDVATLNAGATAFAYAVPTGFVGIDSGAVAGGTTQARAMVLA